MTTTLVTGPIRSGKSRHAEQLLHLHRQVLYVATARSSDDPSWAARIGAHRARRPPEWDVVETLGVAEAVGEARVPVLVDCLGNWLTGMVDEVGWDDLDSAARMLSRRRHELLETLAGSEQEVVLVTNEVGWSLVPLTPSGRFFADELGRLNAEVSALVDRVHLVVAGRVIDLSAAPVVPQKPPPRTLDA